MNIKYYLEEPNRLFFALLRRGIYYFTNDRKYLEILWKAKYGFKLNLDNPKTYNEKLQWLKLYDRNPKYIKMVDKYEVKKYVADILGDEYIIPNLGVWDKFEDINFDELPDKFVLKTTHDSGGVVICEDKNSFNINKAKKTLKKSLARNYYKLNKEWPYKDVKPRIIAEEYIELNSKNTAEYKMFCFNGKVHVVLVCLGKAHDGNSRTNDFFDADFNHLPLQILNPNTTKTLTKPQEYDQLIEIAEKLSAGIPQLRVDTYLVDGKIYFGELTFFHNSGFNDFSDERFNIEWGENIKLPDGI